MKTIEQLKSEVKSLLPEGWSASQCFLMAINGASSPEMVSVDRLGFKQRLTDTPIEQRKEFRRAWGEETVSQAKTIESKLKNAGMRVVRDCGSIFVKLPVS